MPELPSERQGSISALVCRLLAKGQSRRRAFSNEKSPTAKAVGLKLPAPMPEQNAQADGGMITVSITCITPLVHSMSVSVTVDAALSITPFVVLILM